MIEWLMFFLQKGWLTPETVDGRNPGTVEVGSLSHYWHGFIYPRWCSISSINSRWEGEGSSILSSFAVRKRWRFKPVGFDVQLTVRLGGIKRSSTIFAHQFKWTAVMDVGIGCMAGWMAFKKENHANLQKKEMLSKLCFCTAFTIDI